MKFCDWIYKKEFLSISEYHWDCMWTTKRNHLSANPTKWSNTLKQFVSNLPTNCLSVFNHFVKLALKGLTFSLLAELENRYESASPTRLEIREEHIDESLFRLFRFKEYSISFLMISRLIDLCFSSYWCLKFAELMESQKSSFLIFLVLIGLNKIKKN